MEVHSTPVRPYKKLHFPGEYILFFVYFHQMTVQIALAMIWPDQATRIYPKYETLTKR